MVYVETNYVEPNNLPIYKVNGINLEQHAISETCLLRSQLLGPNYIIVHIDSRVLSGAPLLSRDDHTYHMSPNPPEHLVASSFFNSKSKRMSSSLYSSSPSIKNTIQLHEWLNHSL